MRDHPSVKGNQYTVPGALFVAQRPISVSVSASTAGRVLSPQFHPEDIASCSPSELKQLQVLGFLKPGDTVRVDRVYWIRHFDVGDHLEIQGRVLSGSLTGRRVDIRFAQSEKYLRPVEGTKRDMALDARPADPTRPKATVTND